MPVPRVTINKFPGIFGGGGGVTPIPGLDISAYADVPTSIGTVGALVTAWNAFTSTSGEEPTLITDTVTGGKAIRFDVGKMLTLPVGPSSFLHQKATTVLLVWRTRNYTPGADFIPLDSSGGGTTKGYQIRCKEASGQYREIFGRISDGAGFSLDQPSVAVRNSYNALQWNVTAITVTATTFDSQNRGVSILGYPPPIAISNPFQTGTGGALVLGNATIDVAAIEAWSIPIDVSAAMVRLGARFSSDEVITLWGDGVRYFGFASIVKCANGDLLAVCRNGLGHSGDRGWLETRRRPNGSNIWGAPAIVQIDASLDSRDPCLSVMSNGDILLSYFLQNFQVGAPNPLDTCWVRKSSDNGTTWGSPVQGTAGQTNFEACSSRLIDVGGGVVYWPIYGQNIGDAHSSAFLLKSTDGGASFSSHTTVANGVTDAVDYTEPGILHLAAGAGYLYVCREDTNGNMQERTSTDAVTWGAPTNFPATVPGNMAARLAQLASGRVIMMYRPGQYDGAPNVITRTSPGAWTEPPTAMQIDGTPSPTDYGDFAELSPGRVAVAYGIQYTNQGPSDIRFTEFDEWLLDGDMPLPVSPPSASVNVSATQQFTATGAGNIVWSLHTNASGGNINASTGLYTAGVSNGTDVVRATDLNGFFTDVNVTVTGASWNPASAANAQAWASASRLVLNNGDPVPTFADIVHTTVTNWSKVPAGGVAATYVASATPGGHPAIQFIAGTTTAAPVAGIVDFSGPKKLFAVTFKATTLNAAMVLFGQAINSYDWSIEGDGAGKVRALVANATTGKAVSNASVLDSNWHYLIMTVDAGIVTMDLDGTIQTVTGTAASVPFAGNNAAAIGAEANESVIDASTVPSALMTDWVVWSDWTPTEYNNLKTFLAAQIA